jgi:hypothetical protein
MSLVAPEWRAIDNLFTSKYFFWTSCNPFNSSSSRILHRDIIIVRHLSANISEPQKKGSVVNRYLSAFGLPSRSK